MEFLIDYGSHLYLDNQRRITNGKQVKRSTKNRPKINEKSSKNLAKNHQKSTKNHSRGLQKGNTKHGRFKEALGERPMEFLVDFWSHLGPCWTLNGTQIDAKIIQKSMPKSLQILKLLVSAPRRPKTSPKRPQGAPKTAQDTPAAEKWRQNGANLPSKSIL